MVRGQTNRDIGTGMGTRSAGMEWGWGQGLWERLGLELCFVDGVGVETNDYPRAALVLGP